jgi:serine protease Do
VIGMNTAIYSRSGGYNGIGFAAPSNLARRIAEQLIGGGKVTRGYIGVGLQPIDSELQKSLNLPKDSGGTLVARIVDGGPADKAGIEPGDVITAVNKKTVRNESEAINAIGLMSPGTSVNLSIIRNGKAREVVAKIGEYPSDDIQTPKNKGGSREETAFGLTLQKLSPENRQKYNLDSKQGLLVLAVAESSEGERVGLQSGDLIMAVNNKPVADTQTFKNLVKQSGNRVLLRIERAGQYFFVPLRNK